MKNKIYPRLHDKQTVYLKNVITGPNIEVGDYTIYNDFVHDPYDFEQNNVLYHYPINGDRLIIGKFCSIACGAKFLFTSHIQLSAECPQSLFASDSMTKRSGGLNPYAGGIGITKKSSAISL